ncbi:DUF948 domain-containing protein [Oceanobacillus bengalensis]|uniref:DUF948 domain-containing protein n=1 Tax=Oceanobacillus bengalensis TaxID=1435466 RepID=A0A494YVP5_9BACI|nr:DUF948 domain-containing protein [Oceanobacillus bengalensis]RKQ14227.1 DUF948 domain-containing protein [Oceanobacillus bengalensis]
MEAIYIGILLCSIAFFVAVIYISLVLKRVATVTRSLGTTLKEVERQFGYVTPELINTLKETNKILDEMGENIKATDSVFDSVHNVGKSINTLNSTYKNYQEKVSGDQFKKQIKQVVEGVKWGEAVTQVFSKWKKANHS